MQTTVITDKEDYNKFVFTMPIDKTLMEHFLVCEALTFNKLMTKVINKSTLAITFRITTDYTDIIEMLSNDTIPDNLYIPEWDSYNGRWKDCLYMDIRFYTIEGYYLKYLERFLCKRYKKLYTIMEERDLKDLCRYLNLKLGQSGKKELCGELIPAYFLNDLDIEQAIIAWLK